MQKKIDAQKDELKQTERALDLGRLMFSGLLLKKPAVEKPKEAEKQKIEKSKSSYELPSLKNIKDVQPISLQKVGFSFDRTTNTQDGLS